MDQAKEIWTGLEEKVFFLGQLSREPLLAPSLLSAIGKVSAAMFFKL